MEKAVFAVMKAIFSRNNKKLKSTDKAQSRLGRINKRRATYKQIIESSEHQE